MAMTSLVPGPSQSRSDFGIGASEAAAAIGVSKYQRPIDTWLVKTGRREPFAGNEKTRWGQTLEPVIRAHYVEVHGVAVHVPPTSIYHRELPFVRATPDGIVLNDAGKWAFVGPQVKNVGLRMAPAWEENGEYTAPTDYYIQGVVEMAVTNLPRIDFAVLLGGQEYFEVTIERDKNLEADVLEQMEKFWKLVETDTQPELDDSESFRGHLLKQIKRRAHVAATAEDLVLLQQWRDCAVQMKMLKAEESRIKNRVAAVLAAKEAHRLTSELGDITVGNPRKKSAWKTLAEVLGRTVPALSDLETEVLALRAEAVGLADDMGAEPANQRIGAVQALVQRLDVMRAQVRLAMPEPYGELVKRHTTLGDPTLNRPRAWTAGVGGDDDNEEN